MAWFSLKGSRSLPLLGLCPCEFEPQADQGQSFHNPGQSLSESALAKRHLVQGEEKFQASLAWQAASGLVPLLPALAPLGLRGPQHSAPEDCRHWGPPLMATLVFAPSFSPCSERETGGLPTRSAPDRRATSPATTWRPLTPSKPRSEYQLWPFACSPLLPIQSPYLGQSGRSGYPGPEPHPRKRHCG